MRTDTELLRGLRAMMGYVQNGTETTVKLWQDEATQTYHISVDKDRTYWGNGFGEVLDKAIEGEVLDKIIKDEQERKES